MEHIFEREINGKKFMFTCEYWSKSNSWGHKCTLWDMNRKYQISSKKVRYYNRTWEEYDFQSCMKQLVGDLIDNREKVVVNNWKNDNWKTRCMQKKKEELWRDDELINTYKRLYNSL